MPNPTAAVVALALVAVALPGCGPRRVAAPAADGSAALELRATLASASAPSGGGEAAAAPTGTGWAKKLRGRFTFGGDPVAPAPLPITGGDPVCTAGGRKILDRSLLVDPGSKGLADVVVYARKTSRVKEPVPTTPVVFDQKNCEFLTPVFAARVGQPVEIRNSDPVGHNTNISNTSFNQLIAAGGSTPYSPSAETPVPTAVTCNVHPWMKAYGVFRKDGYVAVSAADGSFEIPDLPAGEAIEFQVWHARGGSGGGIGLDKPDLNWTSKGRFTITLQPDEDRDLGTLEVPATALGG